MTLQRKTPMKRSGWKSGPAKQSDWRSDLRANPKRSTLQSKPKRATVAEGSKYLAACRGEPCFLRIVGVCWGDTESVVPAHRNEGKGMGLKVPNILTCPACYACHAEYDQGKRFTREQKRELWNAGYAEWEPVRARKMNLQPELEAA